MATAIESPLKCQIIRTPQGSEEWQSYRAGRITASRIGDVIARRGTKRREGYISQLLRELETGEPDEQQDAWYFERGRVTEPFAIGAYEWKYDVEVEHDVVCIHPEYEWLSCSPDGLVLHGDDLRGIEIKCRFALKRYLEGRQGGARLHAADPGEHDDHRHDRVVVRELLPGRDAARAGSAVGATGSLRRRDVPEPGGADPRVPVRSDEHFPREVVR
jgi:hypothetical protein